jgi:enamidase
MREGAPADFVLLDAPMASSADSALEAISIGDLPAVSAVVTDGVLRVLRSRNTPPPERLPIVKSDNNVTSNRKERHGGIERDQSSVHA